MKAGSLELRNPLGNMDTIANFLIMMKNASRVGKPTVVTPFSNIKFQIAELLSSKGFLGKVSKKNKNDMPIIEVELLYPEGAARITDVERISKPSRRLYSAAKDLRSYKQGLGLNVLSTPKGIMADADAKKENVGGEVLFRIW
jgi:small subunit ribosomal protein S8